MLKKPFWQNVVFTNETRMRILSDGIVKSFSKKWNKISWKKHKKFDTNDHVCFGVQYDRMDANCLLSVQTS